MNDMEILIGTKKDAKKLGQSLWEFNKSIFPELAEKYKPDETICYLLKDKNKMIAGIVGQIQWSNTLYVDKIFIEEPFRKNGYASYILSKLETEAKSRGCNLSVLDTINIEAVTFYEKCGYSIFSKLDNFPCRGICYFSMRKDL